MSARLLRRPQVEELTGLSRSTIYAMIQRGDFPAPVQIGRRAVAWSEAAIQIWISTRLADGWVDGNATPGLEAADD